MNPKDEILEIKILLPLYKGWDDEPAKQLFEKIEKYVKRHWVRISAAYRIRKPFKNEMNQ